MNANIVSLQLLVMFYKNEVKQYPSDIASKALLFRARRKLVKAKLNQKVT
jgi:hypothetical protein